MQVTQMTKHLTRAVGRTVASLFDYSMFAYVRRMGAPPYGAVDVQSTSELEVWRRALSHQKLGISDEKKVQTRMSPS